MTTQVVKMICQESLQKAFNLYADTKNMRLIETHTFNTETKKCDSGEDDNVLLYARYSLFDHNGNGEYIEYEYSFNKVKDENGYEDVYEIASIIDTNGNSRIDTLY